MELTTHIEERMLNLRTGEVCKRDDMHCTFTEDWVPVQLRYERPPRKVVRWGCVNDKERMMTNLCETPELAEGAIRAMQPQRYKLARVEWEE